MVIHSLFKYLNVYLHSLLRCTFISGTSFSVEALTFSILGPVAEEISHCTQNKKCSTVEPVLKTTFVKRSPFQMRQNTFIAL